MYHVLFVICIYIPISCIAFGIKYYYFIRLYCLFANMFKRDTRQKSDYYLIDHVITKASRF